MKKDTAARVETYLSKAGKWQNEMIRLRKIARGCPLDEEIKWGHPCYTWQGKNVVLIHGFKEYCALLFFKGALIKDRQGILVQQTKNVQAARQMRFTGLAEIEKLAPLIKEFILQAIDLEKSGARVRLKTVAEFAVPVEFERRLKKNAKLSKAFAALTPGRQRAYLLHFAAAKQAQTRESRIEKCLPAILAGKGLND